MILDGVPASFRCLFTCVAPTAMRLGELLALQWRYVGLTAKRITVAQLVFGNNLFPVVPETGTGTRGL
jgi:hypothetical protein